MATRILPATQTLGMLYPHTLLLELPTYRQAALDAALAGQREPRPAMIVAHELCHWFDIVGTVWGQDYLDVLFAAYDAALAATDISAYADVLRLFDLDRSILYPSYYKLVIASRQRQAAPGEWQMQLSTGMKVLPSGMGDETDPILFVAFAAREGRVARQPITVGALLELRAISTELSTFAALVPYQSDDEQVVSRTRYRQELRALLYDPELTTYSAGAHLLANAIGARDIGLTLQMGAVLADIALNLTTPVFQRLQVPEDLAGPRRRVRGFKDRANRGFAFAALCYQFRHLRDFDQIENPIATVIAKAGLPDRAAIYANAERALAKHHTRNFRNRDLARIRGALRHAGLEILRQRIDTGGVFAPDRWAALPNPQIMAEGDLATFTLGPAALSQADVDFLYDCDTVAQAQTRLALRAGRGFEFEWTDYVY